MLHVVTRENRHLYTRRLDEMFRLRYEVFIEEEGWSLECEPPREMDQFDNDDAIYFLYFDGEDEIAATFRILPTTVPHLMSEVFSYLCSEKPPVGATIFEGSRVAVRKKYREGGIVMQSMMAGIFEFCLLSGIDQLTGIFYLSVFTNRLKKGADFRPLGPPTEVEGEMYIAFYRPVTIEALQESRRRLGLKGPMLTYIRDLDHAA